MENEGVGGRPRGKNGFLEAATPTDGGQRLGGVLVRTITIGEDGKKARGWKERTSLH